MLTLILPISSNLDHCSVLQLLLAISTLDFDITTARVLNIAILYTTFGPHKTNAVPSSQENFSVGNTLTTSFVHLLVTHTLDVDP